MAKKIMGFDISSSTVGVSILTVKSDGCVEMTHAEYFKPPKKGHIFDRLSKLKTYVKNMLDKWNPDEIAIEDILMGMSGHMTTINTIAILAIFNRTVGLTIYEHCGKVPRHYGPMEIRRALAIDDIIPAKEDVPSFLEKWLKISFPWIKSKRTNKPIIENYDVADGIACALCHILIGSGRDVFPPKKIKKKKNIEKKNRKVSKKRGKKS
jgi:Holliday junction resolvasome RuvABC endonuclease subunit